MGKPHVVICSSNDDDEDQNRTTCERRETAFAVARSECSEEKLKGYHVKTVEGAINTAISRLLNMSHS